MPRTKAPRKVKKDEENYPQEFKDDLARLNIEKEETINDIKRSEMNYQHLNKLLYEHVKNSIKARILDSTMKDLENGTVLNQTMSITSINATLNEKSTKKPRAPLKRCSSFNEDDAESSNAGSTGRRSRSRKPTTYEKTRRRTRSLSKAQNKFFTPATKNNLANSYGLVTPKVKPNTPQIIYRRPNVGEMALSLQGSPLLPSACAMQESEPNINIPLTDGRLFSVQPLNGLRRSEIPELDEETKRKLKTLRDNLEKLCA